MQLKPICSLVWIQRDPAPTLSDVIALPEDMDMSSTGTVKAIGPEVTLVQPGDKVLFSETAGITTYLDKQLILILKEEEIFATIS